ncbi:hypothetical protein JXA80_06075 [bacterium]|nr:hypothetical protein [candidate division CSSED10-310 bacterium]
MADSIRSRRTRNLVDHRIQLGFARIIISYLFLYTVFLVLMFAVPIGYIVTRVDGTESKKMEAVGRFVMGDSHFWGLLAIFVIVIAVHSIIMTQRFAGPIFVFRRHITRLKNGELSRMQLRKNDQLQDVKTILNDHIDQLGEFMTSLAAITENLESLVDESVDTTSDPLALKKEIQRLNELKDKGWHYSA